MASETAGRPGGRAADREVDCSGELCPVPILEARKAIDRMAPGQVLRLITTDLASVVDVQAFTRRTGHRLVAEEEDGGRFVFYIEKVGARDGG